MRYIISIIVAISALVGALYLYFDVLTKNTEDPTTQNAEEVAVIDTATHATSSVRTIGTSVEGRAIEVYEYSAPEITDDAPYILFVGGIHGGYEWNSSLLAYSFIDYFNANPSAVPAGITIGIVPVANPDGLYMATGIEGYFTLDMVPKETTSLAAGRFNANGVDLNRNFDCKWQPESTWRGQMVSAGTAAFSEPEAIAIRELVSEVHPIAGIFWHSQSNAVYASECENGVLPRTSTLMTMYGAASGYRTVESFDAYPVSGDAEGWLASIGIPAITVELATHEAIEWERNRTAVEALLEAYRVDTAK